MNEGMELVPAESLNPAKIFFEGGMESILSGIRTKLDAVIEESNWDVEVESHRTEMKSLAYKVSRSKTLLKKLYDDQVADAKAKIAKAQGAWKPAEATLDKWRDETKQAAVDYEAELERLEEARKEVIINKINYIRGLCDDIDPYSHSIAYFEGIIQEIEQVKIEPDEYYEYTVEANEAKQVSLIKASDALARREHIHKEENERKAEAERLAAERVELNRLRKEQEDRDRVEREKREAEQAAMRAEREALDAEKRKIEIEAAKRQAAEEARIKAEQDAKARAEREAKEKAAAAEREKAEAERKAALMPDVEKLKAFSQFLEEGISYPVCKDAFAQQIIRNAQTTILEIATDILREAEGL